MKHGHPVIQVVGFDDEGDKLSETTVFSDGAVLLKGLRPSYMLSRIRQIEQNEHVSRFFKTLEENIGGKLEMRRETP